MRAQPLLFLFFVRTISNDLYGKEVAFMETENKVLTYAMAFATVSAGVLMLSIVPAALGIRQTQKAQAFNLLADGHRAMSLAKTYDAKAAAQALKTVVSEVM